MTPPFIKNTALLLPPVRRLYERYQRSEADRAALEGERDGLRATLSYLQDNLGKLRSELDRVTATAAAKAEEAGAAVAPRIGRADHWAYLKQRNQLLEVDFPIIPRVRYGHGLPPHPLILQRLEASKDRCGATIRQMLPLLEPMRTIPPHPVADQSEPNWQNLAFPALDAMALYGLVALRRPARFLEIGSGFSTKFARRAIKDHNLPTRVISIDPEPRAEVDAICDEVIRKPLEDVDSSYFEQFGADDLIFYDGSHRAFQNSDVTVFFVEVLPCLKPGAMFGIHDTFLPDDYPPAWLEWYFNEQYMLACWLLAGDKLQIEFAAHYIARVEELRMMFQPFWTEPNLVGANHSGGSFFATIQDSER